jgi:hypothetical protein
MVPEPIAACDHDRDPPACRVGCAGRTNSIAGGPVEVSAGSSAMGIRSSATFTVTGRTRPIRGEDRALLSVATADLQEPGRRATRCGGFEDLGGNAAPIGSEAASVRRLA